MALSLAQAPLAQAQSSRPLVLNLPAESLAAALRGIQARTDSRIIYSPDQVKGVRTNGLSGAFTVTEALAVLLKNTPLTFRVGGDGAIVISPKDQSAAPVSAAGDDPKQPAQLAEVVVTAQKREQAARDVAGSLTALSGGDLEGRGARSIAEFAAYAPGLSFVTSTPGLGQLTLRGITTGVQQSSATVATYVDDTPFTPAARTASGTTVVPDIDPFDIQRIEVLRGPQGTLYGAASMGGLLKYVTVAPNPSAFGARLSADTSAVDGRFGSYGVRAMVNLPLSEDAALRLSANTRQDQGFINDLGDGVRRENSSNQSGGRVSLLWRPSDRLSVRLSSLYQTNHVDGTPIEDLVFATRRPAYGELTQKRALRESTNENYDVNNLTVDWQVGWASLVSSTSYAEINIRSYSDETALLGATAAYYSSVMGYPLSSAAARVVAPTSIADRKFTQELRLVSPDGRRFKWLTGLYFTRETTDSSQAYHVYSATGSTVAPLVAQAYSLKVPSAFKEYAAFVNASYDLTESFNLALGARFSHNRQTAQQAATGFFNNPSAPTAVTRLASASSEDVGTYYFGPRWRVNEAVNAYAVVSSGYRPGGPNGVPPAAPTIPSSYGSDHLWNYEAGLKTQWLDRRLLLDASVFYVDWTHIQLSATTSGFSYLVNGGKASSRGVELDLTYRPIRGLTLGANGVYTRARLDEAAASVGGRAGDQLPTVPRASFALLADYGMPVFGRWTASMGATFRYVGQRNSSFSASVKQPNLVMPAYDTLDLRASLADRDWTLGLYADNVLGERGLLSVDTSLVPSGLAARGTVITPRTVGARVTRGF
ncbi:MAG: TonB-dependent receptor [Caulobacteraceae bacterium]|nr:TonB-dependent receptor [Caulobacteraceae bacterium]